MKRIVATLLLSVMLTGMAPVFGSEPLTPEQEVYNAISTVPIYKAKKEVTVDGDDSEWENIVAYPMLHKSVFGKDTGMEATTQLMYDEDNLYILVKTEDEAHYTHPEDSRYWDADAMQFVLMDAVGAGYGTESGVVYRQDQNEIFITTRNNLTEATKCVNAKVKRVGTETIYEIAVGWGYHFGEVPKEMMFNTTLADGDSGAVRETSIEMRPGTISGKDGTAFQRFILLEEKQSFFAWIDGERRVQAAAEYPYDICIYNTSSATQTYTIQSGEETLSLTVSGGAVGRLPKATAFDGSEKLEEVKATVSCGAETQEIDRTVTVDANEAFYLKLVDKLKTYVAELSDLVNQCNLKNIPTDYENQAVNVLKFYIDELAVDYGNNDYTRMVDYFSIFDEIYAYTKADLLTYLNGEKTAVSVPLMADSAHASEGYHFTAKTTQGERPVFYLGAMTDHNWGVETIPQLSGLGFNMTNPTLGGTYTLGIKGIISPTSYTWGIGVNTGWPEELRKQHSAKIINDNGNNYAVLSAEFDMNDYPTTSLHFGFTQWITLEKGEVYEYGARVKGEDVQFAHVSLSGQKSGAGTIENMSGTYDWREVKGEFSVSSTGLVPVCIRSWGGGTFMADDVYVRNKRTGENLVFNGDFQHDLVIQGKRSEQWYGLDFDSLDDLEKILKDCEEQNLAANIMMGTYSFYELWPIDETINEGGAASPFSLFIKYNPHHPKVLDAMEIWLEECMSRLKNYKSIHSFCLANEPEFAAHRSEFYHPYWWEFLKEKYTTVEALNQRLNTNYTSFEEIRMPTEVSADLLFVEYTDFNNRILLDYWKRMVAIIRKHIPDAKITIKTLHFALDEMVRGADTSNDYEAWAELLDYNGNDGLAYRLENVNELIRTEFWFDYQASVKEAPVMDMEDHILYDGAAIEYDPKIPAWVETNIWQNPMHYVGASIPWVWDREHYSRYIHTEMPYRPDCVWRMGQTIMDANRLAYEIVALQEKKPKIALLYNQYSMNHNQYEMNGLFHAYKAAIYRGEKVGFIVNSQPERLKNYNYLVLGVGSFMPDETFDAVYEFVKDGGKLLILDPQNDEGHDPLMGNPYHEPFDKEKVDFILSKADILPVKKASKTLLENESHLVIKEKVQADIHELGYDKVRLIDEETNQPVEDLEFSYTIYQDNYIINMVNMAWDEPKQIRVEIDGKPVENMTELRRNVYEGNRIKLEPYEPKLIQIPLSGGFGDINGHWAEEEIVRAANEGIAKGKTESIFEPETTINKAEYLAMLMRGAGIEIETKEDVEHWYDSIVDYLKGKGLIDGTFDAESPILREEMAYFAAELLPLSVRGKQITEFADISEAEGRFQNDIRLAGANGIVSGYENGTFRPKETTTRAEAVIMALRALQIKEGNL
ncbi:MAG: S-layer homology domain-containing protein [Clostridia bacterium]|nr:S-layer homology domain-containing protein [Clostridia bacterium]